MRKVLVIRFSSLGDVVLTAPVYSVIKQAWPDAQITVLTKEAFADVLLGNPAIHSTLLLKKGESIRPLIQRVRREKFDVLIDLHSNLRSRLISLCSGARLKAHYKKAALARRLYVGYRLSSEELQRHTLDRYFQTLQSVDITPPISKILVIQTAFLGDAVLTLPFLNALKQQFPTTPITVLCTPEVAEVFKNHPAVTDTVIFDKRRHDKGVAALFRVVRQLRQQNFPIAFLPHRSFKSAWMAWSAGIPRRVGFSRSQGRFLLTDVVPFDWGTHDAERNLALLKAVGIQRTSAEFALQVDPASLNLVKERFGGEGVAPGDRVLGINAGSVWATKRWLPEGFAAVADRAIRELKMKVVFFGGPSDAEAVNQVLKHMQEKAINWVGKTPLRELIAAISQCHVFLSNDSGPMHIAVACRVPTVAIFGPTTRELGFFPYGPGHIVVEKDLECRPCGLHGAKACPLGHFQCMKMIHPDAVFSAVSQQLRAPMWAGASA